jgi:tRNA(adenine34) deaminase
MTTSTKKRSTPKKWSAGVTTSSTKPPEGLFTERAAVIARSLASKEVSPKGPSSGLRMLTFYINRAGKELTEDRRKELEKAKSLLSERVHSLKNGRAPA